MIALLFAALAAAQDSIQTRPGAVALDPKSVEHWVDSLVEPALKTSGVPGAVVVVVRRSGVILNKGYGVADVMTKTPVNPNVTLFKTASIGKSFTAIVVEQLLAEGVLNLDEDVNHYLKIGKITGPKVTLRMLLAHRGGFDDDITGLFVPFDGDIRMLGVLNDLTDSFAVRFIPADRPRSSEGAVMTPDSTGARLDEFLGTYVLATNHSRSFVSRFGGWLGTVRLERVGADGVRLGGIEELGDYHPVGPLLYENAKRDRIALARSPIGRLMAVGLSGGIFRQTNFIESPGWSVPLFAIAMLVLLTDFAQLRRKAPPELRRLARFTLIGLGSSSPACSPNGSGSFR